MANATTARSDFASRATSLCAFPAPCNCGSRINAIARFVERRRIEGEGQ